MEQTATGLRKTGKKGKVSFSPPKAVIHCSVEERGSLSHFCNREEVTDGTCSHAMECGTEETGDETKGDKSGWWTERIRQLGSAVWRHWEGVTRTDIGGKRYPPGEDKETGERPSVYKIPT